MKYVSVDLETTSLDSEKGQILELAMVLEDTSVNTSRIPVEELSSFSTPVDPGPIIRGDAFALVMNARLLSTIAKKGCWTTEQAEAAAIAWLSVLPPGPIFMAAKNGAGFDLVWLKRHMPALAARFSHRVIDPGSVLIDWNTGPVSLGKILGGEAKHEALEDARDNIRALRRSYT